MLFHHYSVSGRQSRCLDCGQEAKLYGCRCPRFVVTLKQGAIRAVPGKGFELGGVQIPACPFCLKQLQQISQFGDSSPDNPDCENPDCPSNRKNGNSVAPTMESEVVLPRQIW